MEKKADIEYKQLVKIGVPENMAYLIVSHKYKVNEDEVNSLINDVKEQQTEIQKMLSDFVPLEKNLEMIENEKNINLISNININDKNKDKTI